MIIMGPQNSGEQSGFVRESTIFYFLIGIPCAEREAVQNINLPGRGRGRGRGKGGEEGEEGDQTPAGLDQAHENTSKQHLF